LPLSLHLILGSLPLIAYNASWQPCDLPATSKCFVSWSSLKISIIFLCFLQSTSTKLLSSISKLKAKLKVCKYMISLGKLMSALNGFVACTRQLQLLSEIWKEIGALSNSYLEDLFYTQHIYRFFHASFQLVTFIVRVNQVVVNPYLVSYIQFFVVLGLSVTKQ